jgi:hypothetical protein
MNLIKSLEKMDVGREAVLNFLTSTGWKVAKPVTTDIEDVEISAEKNSTKILLLIRVAETSEEPVSLTEKQKKEIRKRASEIDADAYETKILLDKALEPKKINFKKLN